MNGCLPRVSSEVRDSQQGDTDVGFDEMAALNREFLRPGIASSPCEYSNPTIVLDQITRGMSPSKDVGEVVAG